jgi:ubiquinone/menaquinone biosynthesis C-methylase UbiE
MFAGLNSGHNVLDIGCGIGRTAVALKSFLNPNSKYEGFDVVEKGILWCQKNISKDFPNFNFKYTPLNNDLYFLTDKKADRFNFPYNDSEFDTVFLFSVFTHMQPLEVQNYLNEIRRVLKANGKCLTTAFVYDETIEAFIASENSKFLFPFNKDGFRLMNEKVPSANIAFSENKFNQMLKESGLKLVDQINGTWKNSDITNAANQLQSFQDVLVFEKL